MAATLSVENVWKLPNVSGRNRLVMLNGKVTFDSAYAAGGEGINLTKWLNKIHHVSVTPAEDGTSGGYLPAVTDTNFAAASTINIELFCQSSNQTMAAFNEVTANRQLQSVVNRILVIGE